MSEAPRAGDIGTAVLLAERGELTCARVMRREGSRFALENLEGERFAVSTPRLFWIGRARVATAVALAEHWAKVRRAAGEIDLAAAWDALEARGAEGDVELVAAIGLPAGARREDPAVAEDAVALAVFADTTFFRIRERRLRRESAAEVAKTRAKQAAKETEQRRFELAVAGFAARLGGEAREVGLEEAAAMRHFVERLIDVAARGRESTHWSEVAPLCQALGSSGERAFDLLVRLGELAPHANLAPYRASIPMRFSPELLAEAERLAAHVPRGNKDLGALSVIAIDDADTTEVDDAMALSGSRVYVLISDAAAWVQSGTALDRAAAERTATVYLPDGKLPMIPPSLSEGPLSLNCDGSRAVLAFSFELAPDGSLSGFEIERATISVRRRLTYPESDAILAAPASDPAGPLLSGLAALMNRHRAWRHGRGAVTFQRPEVYFDAPPGGAAGPVQLKIGDPLAPARQLVQELMIATCTGAAIFCAEHQIPCIYRAQSAPADPPKVADPRTGRIEDPALQYELLRRLKPSVLQLEAAAHWTLGVPAYTQVTSPIRRYADLLMHQQISAYLKTGRPLMPAAKLQAHLFELGRRATIVKRVEQESRRFFALRYLEQNPQQVLTGTVLRDIGKKTLCELQPVALQELIALKRRRPPGTTLRFEVIAVDARGDSIQLKELV